MARVQAKAARYIDTAALYQALGGGWWNEPKPKDGKADGETPAKPGFRHNRRTGEAPRKMISRSSADRSARHGKPGLPVRLAGRPLLLGLLAIAFSPFVARADSDDPENALRARQTVVMTDENDFWGKWSDKYYTNGSYIGWTTPDWLTTDPSDTTVRRLIFSAGQEMYTPKNTAAANPPLTEYPYSALTYVSGGYTWDHDDSLCAAELRLGMIGPSAMGEEAQRMVHTVLGDSVPGGWDTQMPDEPAFDVVVEFRHRYLLAGQFDSGWACDLIPRGAVELGNIPGSRPSWDFSFAIGFNLPGDYGYVQVR